MQLGYSQAYRERGLDGDKLERLSVLGDMLRNAGLNVTGIREPEAIERFHFLDCLSLQEIPEVRSAKRIADLGSGAGLPALVLALTLPGAMVTAVESLRKKCVFIEKAAFAMELENLEVRGARAEEYGLGSGRAAHDLAVSRALAALPVVIEYSLPLLREGGSVVAMKGAISNDERIHAQKALDILGGGELRSTKLVPFPGAENRWVYIAKKVGPTPAQYPRRPGLAARRPLGGS